MSEGESAQDSEHVRKGRRKASWRRQGRVSVKLARKDGVETRMGSGKPTPPVSRDRPNCTRVPESGEDDNIAEAGRERKAEKAEMS